MSRARVRRACATVVTVVASVLTVVAAQPASAAAVLHVPSAFPTIQAALDASAAGDTILVDPGVYTENLDYQGKDVRVESTGGPAATTVDVNGGTAVTIGPAGAFVGFTVTGAVAPFGAGMDISGLGTLVQGNVFDGNIQESGGFGAAIAGNGASPTVDRNVFRNNTCDGQFLSGVVSFVNSSSPVISNNLFTHNPCRAINMTLPEGNTPLVVNNTMVDNQTGVRVDSRIPTELQSYRNNIVVGNEIGLDVDFGPAPTWEHNLVFGNGTNYVGIADQTGIAGNVSVDPLFVDATVDNFRLRPGSPAVDAGAGDAAPDHDFDGNLRPVDGNGDTVAAWDIGAFELPPGGARQVAIDIRPGDERNQISLRDRSVPVAVLSTADFDAPAVVDLITLTFGRTGDEPSRDRCVRRDANRDGRIDLVCTFLVGAAGFQLGDTTGVLKGRTRDGASLEGRDSVTIVR